MTQNTPRYQEFDEDDLFKFTAEKKWDKVAEIYKNHPECHKTKLTKFQETALHISVSSYISKHLNDSKHIKQMIDCIEKSYSLYDILSMQNVNGDTPLHLAAAVGWEEICEYIASKDRNLINLRNASGETPLFIAAHHGKLQAFLCLHEIYNKQGEADESLCRRNDGTTILHVAISGEYFRLAYHIIRYYPTLINSVNVNGESPLHVLARKPHVFKSSRQLGFFDSIIYRLALVDELKKEEYNPPATKNGFSPSSETNYPENCTTGQHRGKSDEEKQAVRTREFDRFPPNYTTCVWFFKLVMSFLGVLGINVYFMRIKNIKEQNSHAFQIMSKMIESESRYKYDANAQRPTARLDPEEVIKIPDMPPEYPAEHDALQTKDLAGSSINPSIKAPLRINENGKDQNKSETILIKDTPLLVAAKTGIPEMVKKIIETWPVAIQDVDSNGKNMLLRSVENRQISVFDYLIKTRLPDYIFYGIDNQGNNILHVAAMLGEDMHPWRTPCVPLQMSWEIKWYQHVEACVPPLVQDNTECKSPRKIFTETHTKLVREGKEWLTTTLESCSVISTLIASVTFATIANVPGGLNGQTGHPILGNYTAFDVFSVASFFALCLSVTALIFFLGIITSRCVEGEFKTDLPRKLLIGLTSMSGSIAAMLVAFCAGHTFILTERLRAAAVPIYAVVTLPVMFFAIAQLPLYFDILCAAFIRKPLLRYRLVYN